MMRLRTQREKIIFNLCVIMVLIFLSYKFGIAPLIQKTKDLDRDAGARRQELARNIHFIKKGQALAENSGDSLSRFQQTESSEQVMSSLVSEIEQTANQLNLSLSEIKPQKVKKEKYYNQFLVSLTIDSSWLNTLQFLHSLQQEPHLFSIEEITVDKGSAAGSSRLRTQLVLGKSFIPAVDFKKQNIVLPQIDWKAADEDRADVIRDVPLSPAEPFSFYEEKFKERDIFLSPWEKVSGAAAGAETQEPLFQSLKVIGIFLDQDPKAVVENLKNQQVYFLSPGEDLEGAKVKEIREDKVIFIYNNTIVEMGP